MRMGALILEFVDMPLETPAVEFLWEITNIGFLAFQGWGRDLESRDMTGKKKWRSRSPQDCTCMLMCSLNVIGIIKTMIIIDLHYLRIFYSFFILLPRIKSPLLCVSFFFFFNSISKCISYCL